MRVLGVLVMAGTMLHAARLEGAEIAGILDTYTFSAKTAERNFGIMPEKEIHKFDDIDLIVSQPYCGNFSAFGAIGARTNENRNLDTSMRDLEYLKKAVELIRPRAIIVENLPKAIQFIDFKAIFKAFGYHVYYHHINYADYGTPQKRRRLLVVAIRNDSGIEYDSMWPHRPELKVERWTTFREAMKGLPLNTEIPEINHAFHKSCRFTEARFYGMKPLYDKHPLRKGRVKRDFLNYFSWFELMHPAQCRCIDEETIEIDGKIYTKEDFVKGIHPGFFKPTFFGNRLSKMDEPTNTIAHEGHFHPITKRELTPRERARLLDLPDDFIYVGSMASLLNQTSKTVPVKTVRVLIRRLIKDGL